MKKKSKEIYIYTDIYLDSYDECKRLNRIQELKVFSMISLKALLKKC